jgi:predicted transcriptional regulator
MLTMFPKQNHFLAGPQMVRSSMQSEILAALPQHNEKPIPAEEIFKRLGMERPTLSQRASLSRSLARLAEEGIVTRHQTKVARQGHGYLYSKA